MKINAVFSSDSGNTAGWAVMIANELKELVKENAPKIIKKS